MHMPRSEGHRAGVRAGVRARLGLGAHDQCWVYSARARARARAGTRAGPRGLRRGQGPGHGTGQGRVLTPMFPHTYVH